MLKVKLTAKRQATFPVHVCQSLGVNPGDELLLEPLKNNNGSEGWVLKPAKVGEYPHWFGSARKYAQGKDHSMNAIRESIARGRKKEWQEKYG